MTNAVWVQAQEPVGNANFSTVIRSNLSGHFELTEDVDLNKHGEDGQSRSPWTPIGSESQPFNGTLDGNDHIVYGLNVKHNGIAGLFSTLINARVENLVLVQPCVMSSGNNYSAGAVAGSAFDSTINHCINRNGTVSTTGQSSDAGGVVGEAFNSTVSNNLNTGEVSTTEQSSDAGGAVGQAFNSTVSTNLNTGKVSTHSTQADAGGAAGQAFNCTVSTNLNTGAVSTDGVFGYAGGAAGLTFFSTVSNNLNTAEVSTKEIQANAGGTVGQADSSSTVSNNLNTGPVSTHSTYANAGGTVGLADSSSTVSNNLNTGAISTDGTAGYAGGAAGLILLSTVSNNLNTAEVSTNGTQADAGGTVGRASSSTVSNNLNTGEVSTNGTQADAGGAAGQAFNSTVSNNLNTGAVTVAGLNSSTNPEGFLPLLEADIKRNSGLNLMLWADGDSNQFPIPRSVSMTYRDLRRINGTQDGANVFPEALEEFADPGGSINGSLFDQGIWNVLNGYLPFLKSISRQRAVEAGINCDPGGFACSEEISTEPVTESTTALPLSTEPVTESTTAQPLSTEPVTESTTALTLSTEPVTEPPTGSCPAPVGKPVFQAYDNENQWLYVVARERDLMLIRYRGHVLDESFGDCGKVIYQAPNSRPLNFYPITSGLFQKSPDSTHIYLMASGDRSDGFIHLLDLVISDTDSTHTLHTITYPNTVGFGARVNAMVAHGGRLYMAGRANDNVMVGWFQELVAGRFSDEGTMLGEYGQAMALSPDASHAYVTGLKGSEVFLRKYDLQSLTQDTAFNNQAEQVLDQNNYNSRQAVVFFKDRVYVASSVDRGEGLIVRRYYPDGMEDGSFRVDEETPSYDSEAQVVLFTSDNFLHVLKYDRYGRIFAASYDTGSQGEAPVSDAVIIDSPHFVNAAPHGIAMTDGKVYLAFQLHDNFTGELSIFEVEMPHLTVVKSDYPSDGSSDAVVLGTAAVIVTAVMLVSIGVVGYYLKKYLRNRPEEKVSGTGWQTKKHTCFIKPITFPSNTQLFTFLPLIDICSKNH